jgi:putative MATE family efflux protein
VQDLTKGPIIGHLVKFASFIALSTLMQTLYLLIDLYFVGRLGPAAIAGVGLAGNLMMIVLGLTQSMGVGATSLVAQALGAQDRERAGRVFNQAFVLSAFVGAAFFVVAFSLRGVYARALAADEATAREAIAYLTWFVPALTLHFALISLGATLRGMGDMKIPTAIQVATVLINVILAPILIMGWGTGVSFGAAGAGMATFFAVVFGAAAFFLYVQRPSSPFRLHSSLWKPDVSIWKSMLGIGLPAGGEFGLIAVYMVVVYDLIQGFGAAAQAGFGVGLRVMQAMFLPAVAIGFATAPVVGQNFGARQGDRVRQTFVTAATISASVMLIITLLCHIAPEAMIAFFSSDADVIAFGTEYLRIVSWNFAASGVIFVGSSTLQGIGNTRPGLLASAMRLVAFALVAYPLAGWSGFEMRHVWYWSVTTVMLHAALLVWLVRRQFAERLAPLPAPATSQ